MADLPDDASELPLRAYALSDQVMPLRVAPRRRSWMDDTPQHYAYRCLPLVIANQIGWEILSPVDVAAVWTGGTGLDAVQIGFGQKRTSLVSSHFGAGILTFTPGYLFRTPPGHNLWCLGPANAPRDGIAPLEGVIETDWLNATFTMNWRFTRAHHPVVFRAGEPVCRIVPLPRGYLQRFTPEIVPLRDDPAAEAAYREWRQSRSAFLDGLSKREPAVVQEGWQRDYVLGRQPDGSVAESHETRLALRDFTDRRS